MLCISKTKISEGQVNILYLCLNEPRTETTRRKTFPVMEQEEYIHHGLGLSCISTSMQEAFRTSTRNSPGSRW